MNRLLKYFLIFTVSLIGLISLWLIIMWGPEADTKKLNEYPKDQQIYIRDAVKRHYDLNEIPNGVIATINSAGTCEDGSLEYHVSFRQYNFLNQKVAHSGHAENCDGSSSSYYGGIYLYPNQK